MVRGASKKLRLVIQPRTTMNTTPSTDTTTDPTTDQPEGDRWDGLG
jgi:hypothetical protein